MAPLHLLYCKCSFVIRLTAQNYSACQAVDNQLYTCKGISVCSMNKKRKSCAAVTAVCASAAELMAITSLALQENPQQI